jgi:thioredoxin-like negative regulator of GroEL
MRAVDPKSASIKLTSMQPTIMKPNGWPPLLALLFATSLAGGAAPVRSIEFHHSIEEARKAAKPERPMVILFGASWCGWCRKMEADTLTASKVETIADKFLWVKVDVDKDPELATRYGADGVPVTVVVDNQGRVLGMQGGYIPPDKFVEFLTKSLANPHPDELLPDLLARFVKSHAPAEEREATERLVQQLAKPARSGRDEILAAFQKKGAATWPLLLGLMANDRLSVRAAAAGALKHASKAGLPFHPFAESPVRQQQIAGWQKWLATHPAGP